MNRSAHYRTRLACLLLAVPSRAGDGTVLSTARSHMPADAVIGALLLSYRW
ncbi:MAG: hypothetical protein Q7J29_08005 [Stagnimonas sp.]|nr:hypothetical protein [Stagnimonas sp.]